MNKPFLLFIFSLLFIETGLASHEAVTQKRVLLLYSYHPEFPTTPKIHEGFYKAFENSVPRIDSEFMDSKRLYDVIAKANFLRSLSHKLANRAPYDVVVTADDNALAFAASNKDTLFPNAKIVFLGINNISLARSLSSDPNITGVVEASSLKEGVLLGRQLFPQRVNAYVIADNTTSGQADIEKLRQIEHHLPGVSFQWLQLSKLSWRELSEQLMQLGVNDTVFLLSAYRDKNGVEKSFEESVTFIDEQLSAPLFHFWEHGIGQGVFGGLVVSHTEQGYQAGLMVKQILEGTEPSALPFMDKSPNKPIFDHAKLAEFNVSERALPPGSLILFKPPTLISLYFTELIAASVVLLLLLILVFYLARKNAKMRRLSRALGENEKKYRLLFEEIVQGVVVYDAALQIIDVNPAAERILSRNATTLLNQKSFPEQWLAPNGDNSFDLPVSNCIQAAFDSGNANHTVVIDGEVNQKPIWLSLDIVPVQENGACKGVFVSFTDITKAKHANSALRLSASVFESTIDGVIITDADTRIIDVNTAFCAITGYDKKEVIGKKPNFLSAEEQDEYRYRTMWANSNTDGPGRAELYNRKKDGTVFPVKQSVSAVKDDKGQLSHYVAVLSDISYLKQSQQEIYHLAYHDSLTNLPNRRLLFDRLTQAIHHAQRSNTSFTLMYLDLDNFKNVNDSLGHSKGDQLLQFVSRSLLSQTRDCDTVARVGGDEFVILFDDLADAIDIEALARKVLEIALTPVDLSGSRVSVSASLGICIYPKDGETPETLLRNADIAMYCAKKDGRNTFRFFEDYLSNNVLERVTIEHELRHAIAQDELYLVYQPQIDIRQNKVVGVEALLRWENPKLGIVSPLRMIPVAEETGLIKDIGAWVLDTALKQARQWLDCDIPFGRVAVNLSGQQLLDGYFAGTVEQLLERYQLSASNLALEVTETFIMHSETASLAQLRSLEKMGVELAIDDFGTGYSSLSYLKKLPVNKLKIDKSFILDIPADEDDIAITQTILSLGKTLGLNVIAEGVETYEQATFLREQGCDEVQGYYYSRPLRATELEKFLLQAGSPTEIAVKKHIS